MDNSAIEEMFQSLGHITIKKMFGGKSIYVGAVIVGIEYKHEILLKADQISAPNFAEAGCRRWVYESKSGKTSAMPYWSIPEDAFDDPDIMAKWMRLALEAGMRAQNVAMPALDQSS